MLVAVTLITLCFFGDGAIEGYVALYLRDLLGAGALLTGVGLALFHGASLAGRLASSAALGRLGERNLITLAGAGAAAGMLVIVLARSPGPAAAGLLLVGISLSPVVPDGAVGRGPLGPGARGRRRVAGDRGRLRRVRARPAVHGRARRRDIAAHGARAGDRLDRAARAHRAAALT